MSKHGGKRPRAGRRAKWREGDWAGLLIGATIAGHIEWAAQERRVARQQTGWLTFMETARLAMLARYGCEPAAVQEAALKLSPAVFWRSLRPFMVRAKQVSEHGWPEPRGVLRTNTLARLHELTAAVAEAHAPMKANVKTVRRPYSKAAHEAAITWACESFGVSRAAAIKALKAHRRSGSPT